MNIKKKLIEYVEITPCLNYPTYKMYALYVLGEVSNNPDLKKRENDKKAKRLIDDKYNELMMCESENKRVNEVFKKKEEKPREKKKKKTSNNEELNNESND